MGARNAQTVADLGEFALIARISRLLPPEKQQLLVGIGDDACAFVTPEGRSLLLTTDVVIEGVHFRREWGTWRQVGKKAMAASLSDVAAMGGKPLWALVSLGLEPDTPVSVVDDLYEGLNESASQAGAQICGGDTVRSPSGVCLGVTVLGEVRGAGPVRRGVAKPGDVLLVTGSLGGSLAGLAVLEQRGTIENRGSESLLRNIPAAAVEEALKAHLEPQARSREGMLVAEAGLANAMIDISDGLLADLEHICAASSLGAQIDSLKVPIAQCCNLVAEALGRDQLAWAMEGGEDYELLFTCPPNRAEEARELVRSATGTPVTAIGSMTEDKGITVLSYQRSSGPGGYRHF